MGKAMLRMALVFAQLEREQNSERVSDVMTFRAEQGLFNGGTNPFGYDIVNKELIPHKQERKILEFIFNKFIETKSTAIVARELTAQGFLNRNSRPWNKRRVDYILRNPIYIGKIQWNESMYNGVHQPLITEAVFNKIQEIFKNRKYYRDYKVINGLFKGVLICGSCGSAMIPNYTRKKNSQSYFYYRCISTTNASSVPNCKNKYIRMEDANNKVIEKILELAEEKELNKFEQEINKQNTKINKTIDILKLELEGLGDNLKTIKSKKEKYIDALIANNYVVNERETINSKIEEFSMEEKKTQSEIYKKEFALSGLDERLLSVYEFKKEMVFIKINYSSLDNKDLHDWINRNIEQVIYAEEINIKFKLLNK
jgi:site-specific DNA recombinase